MRIGVYICRVSAETDGGANLESVGHYAANLPQVEVVRSLGLLPRLDPGGARGRDRRRRARQGRDRRRLARVLQAGLHASDVAGRGRAGRSAARVVPRARGERRRTRPSAPRRSSPAPSTASRSRWPRGRATRSGPRPRSSSAAASPASRRRSRSPTPARRSTWSSAPARSAATWPCSTRPSPPSTAPPAS